MNPVLLTLVAGLTASLMGFLSGSVLLKYKGDRALVLFVPVMEETLKTLAAVVFGAGIVPTHLVFGMVEALYDLYSSPAAYSTIAAALSIASHMLFGTATWFILRYSGSVVLAVLAASVLHSLWNRIMTAYTG
ncbi:MAG: hypothetical protein ACOX42_07965 [Clostridia bacterium]|jgi:hypothetical protein